jgi:hypothetical protein
MKSVRATSSGMNWSTIGLVTFVVALTAGCAQAPAGDGSGLTSADPGPGSDASVLAGSMPRRYNQTLQGDLGVAPCVQAPGQPCVGPLSYESKRAFVTAVDGNVTVGTALLSWSASNPAMDRMTFYAGSLLPCPDDPNLDYSCFSTAGVLLEIEGPSPLELPLDGYAVAANHTLGFWVKALTQGASGAEAKLYLPQPYTIDVRLEHVPA